MSAATPTALPPGGSTRSADLPQALQTPRHIPTRIHAWGSGTHAAPPHAAAYRNMCCCLSPCFLRHRARHHPNLTPLTLDMSQLKPPAPLEGRSMLPPPQHTQHSTPQHSTQCAVLLRKGSCRCAYSQLWSNRACRPEPATSPACCLTTTPRSPIAETSPICCFCCWGRGK